MDLRKNAFSALICLKILKLINRRLGHSPIKDIFSEIVHDKNVRENI